MSRAPPSLLEDLRELEKMGLLERAAETSEPEYSFRHALIQEAAYGSLLKRDRRHLHQKVGEALERLYPERVEQLAASLARHFELGGARPKAIEHYLTAADRARATFANKEAIELYRAGLGLLEEEADGSEAAGESWADVHGRLAEGLADVLELTGDLDASHAAYERALAASASAQRSQVSRLHRRIASTYITQRRYDQAEQSVDQAELALGPRPVGEDAEWWMDWVNVLTQRFVVHYWRNEIEPMERVIAEIRPVVERHGSVRQRADFFDSLVNMAHRRDRYRVSDETLDYARRVLTASEELGDPLEVAWTHFSLGFCYLWRFELDQAEEHFGLAAQAAERFGEVRLRSRARTYLVMAARKRGDVAKVRRMIPDGVEAARAAQLVEYEVQMKAHGAWVAWRDEQLDDAWEQGTAVLEEFRRLPIPYPFDWTVLWPLIGVCMARGLFGEAIEHARQLFPPPQQLPPDELAGPTQKAIAAWDRDDRAAAAKHLERAMETARAIGYL